MKRLILALCLIAAPVLAVQPDEILDDPVLESRAREISKELRCLVCRNENIDDSNAELARDLRLLVRERLTAGDSDVEVVNYIVDRYGEYVLLNPTARGANWVLWAAGPIMLITGLGLGFIYLRRRQATPEQKIEELSDVEKARLAEIMDD
ncbi:Cytochrome c-type biogenesis protein CcmH precursor [Thalassovita gelatinovora]|uniref:Cytochrome c-type biogenesis protein n=1 Tax=Thalassovita gelatinovora TaxID=53501 RepID=A0A0P1FNE0_THAGE|nr:cytochrome c-type biogenesis protein [Thalassovita gelatinovora]QIZ79351.1 cytochrome c-type biogenesis protein CcmH [Thalassovita gelatinovora]CUH62628.1 Cytochrome c-type biogenesis protein CcmH precursor [Thalassovita gelatinovora]SEQ07557.1 cytochrome c-type biogenesis protein CcmH [Thalassovita gelatinovora]